MLAPVVAVTFAYTASAPAPADIKEVEDELADVSDALTQRYLDLLRGWWAAAQRHVASPSPRLGPAIVQGLTASYVPFGMRRVCFAGRPWVLVGLAFKPHLTLPVPPPFVNRWPPAVIHLYSYATWVAALVLWVVALLPSPAADWLVHRRTRDLLRYRRSACRRFFSFILSLAGTLVFLFVCLPRLLSV